MNGKRNGTQVSGVAKMIEALAATDADDLVALDAEIAKEEQAIDELVAGRRKKLDALKRLRAVIDVQVNGKKPKASKAMGGGDIGEQRRKSPAGGLRDKIYDWLSKQKEPAKPTAIADAVGCSKPGCYAALQHEWFSKTDEGYEIATAK